MRLERHGALAGTHTAMDSRRRHPLLVCLLIAVWAVDAAYGAEYTVTDQVFLDVSVGEAPPDRIVLGLFGDLAPKTVRNFIALAGDGVNGRSYKGAIFHRVIRKFMIQGGDVMRQDGTGSTSLYGESFDDETFQVKHTAPGTISMANAGKNTNGCQFFITTVPTPWLDNIHVAFGKVVEGMAVVHKIENTATDAEDRPLRPVVITDAGVLPTPKPFVVTDEPYDIWEWIRGASVPLAFSFSILAFFHWMIRQLDNAVKDEEAASPFVENDKTSADSLATDSEEPPKEHDTNDFSEKLVARLHKRGNKHTEK